MSWEQERLRRALERRGIATTWLGTYQLLSMYQRQDPRRLRAALNTSHHHDDAAFDELLREGLQRGIVQRISGGATNGGGSLIASPFYRRR